MNDHGDIRIKIDGDDGADEPTRSVEEINREAERHRAETARLNHATAQHRAEIAHNRIASALSVTETEAAAARLAVKESYDVGDTAAAAEASERLAEIAARKVRLQEHQEALQRAPAVPADPVEAYCQGRTEPTAKWLREHSEWVTDPRKQAKLTGAHYDAVGEGLTPDTPEYFEHVEKRISLQRGGNGNGNGGRRPAIPNVVKNDPNTHISRGGREVYLTAGEAKAATDGSLIWNYGPNKGQPIGTGEYARRKAAMVAEGRYNKLES
jgi:hypothetical protein